MDEQLWYGGPQVLPTEEVVEWGESCFSLQLILHAVGVEPWLSGPTIFPTEEMVDDGERGFSLQLVDVEARRCSLQLLLCPDGQLWYGGPPILPTEEVIVGQPNS